MTTAAVIEELVREPRTAEELAARFGAPVAEVRAVLAQEVFRGWPRRPPEGRITCDAGGRYRLGDPTRLWDARLSG